MADRRDFYYRQKVLEEELDAAYEGLENAERALASDLDFVGRTPPSTKADFGGIVWGLDVTFGGGLNIIVAAGAAYGELGIRAHVPSDTTVTLSSQGDTQIGQGGTGDGAPIALASGTECWVTVFLRFDRLLSDQRYDGYNNLVYHQRDESFYFTLEQGTPRTIGSLTVGDKPARKLYHTLLADVHMKNTGGGIFIDSIDTGDDTQRTEWYFDYEATNPIYGNPARRIHAKKNIRDALAQMLEYYNDHAAGLEDKHKAIDILWTASEAWADGESVSATDVYNALNEIIADLAVKQPAGVASSGSRKIGTRALTGGADYIDSGNPYSIPQTTVQDVLEQLTEHVNSRVFRGGDASVDFLYPKASGTQLGQPAGNKWDAYFRDLYVDRYLRSALIPEVADDDSFDIGTAAARIRNLFLGTTLQNDGISTLNGNVTTNDQFIATGGEFGRPTQTALSTLASAESREMHHWLLTGTTRQHYHDFRRIAKRSGTGSGTGGEVVHMIDAFGFEERGQYSEHNCVLAEPAGAAFTNAEFQALMNPWHLNQVAGSPTVYNAIGQGWRQGVAFDASGLGDILEVIHGSNDTNVAPYQLADLPGIYFSFIQPTAAGNFDKGKIAIGFISNPADAAREVSIEFDGQAGGTIDARYWDGGVLTTQTLSGSPAQNQTYYMGRILIMSYTAFLFQIKAIGAGAMDTQYLMIYGGASPWATNHRMNAFIQVTNGGTAGGPVCVFHRLNVSTLIDPQWAL
jgi:hypothetical protein